MSGNGRGAAKFSQIFPLLYFLPLLTRAWNRTVASRHLARQFARKSKIFCRPGENIIPGDNWLIFLYKRRKKNSFHSNNRTISFQRVGSRDDRLGSIAKKGRFPPCEGEVNGRCHVEASRGLAGSRRRFQQRDVDVFYGTSNERSALEKLKTRHVKASYLLVNHPPKSLHPLFIDSRPRKFHEPQLFPAQ